MRTTFRAALAAIALTAVLAGCGDDDGTDADASQESTTESTTTTAPAATTEPSDPDASEPTGTVPERIVSMTPTGTETLYAVGAGDAVVAVDDYSTFPEGAPVTDLSAFEPNVEAIASYEPDLVLLSGDNEATATALEELDIDVLLLQAPTELDEAYEQMTAVGEATGHGDEAAELVAEVKAEIAEIVESTGDAGEGLTYYYELDPTYYSVTSATFIGQLLGLLGLENIADEAQAEASDYPQLSPEYIIQQDPDLILLADTKCCAQDAAAVAARDGWSGLEAVQGEGVVELDDDIASRWGPRIVDLLEVVSEAAQRIAA
jgi:iron complex transport system substrate-binding protein